MKEEAAPRVRGRSQARRISVNAAIERRLNRTLIDDKIRDIIAETSKQFRDAIVDHLHNLMMDRRANLRA